jgi:hypothetical protein
MAIVKEKGQLQLEKKAYHDFLKLWHGDKFRELRLGQAFYEHFKLYRLADQDQLHGLYEKDGDEAHKVIGQVFRFN